MKKCRVGKNGCYLCIDGDMVWVEVWMNVVIEEIEEYKSIDIGSYGSFLWNVVIFLVKWEIKVLFGSDDEGEGIGVLKK